MIDLPADLKQPPAIVRPFAGPRREVSAILPGVTGAAAAASRRRIDPDLVFLCHFDGADAATEATDAALGGGNPHTITFSGGAQLDTAEKKFGTASLLLDGSGDFVSMADHADFNLGSSDFTIDFFIRKRVTALGMLFTKRANDSANDGLLIHTNGDTNFLAYASSNGSTWDIANAVNFGSLANTTWGHIAWTRSGSDWRLFVNGVIGASFTSSAAINNNTAPFRIGADSATSFFDGHIDEFRIVKGRALWTANFTPPSAPGTPYL